MHGLIGPEAVKVEWRLQLRLIEADQLGSVMLEKVIDDLLFGFTVEPANVEGDHCKLLQFGLHIREVTFDVWPLVVALHISSLSLMLRSTLFEDLLFCFLHRSTRSMPFRFFFSLLFLLCLLYTSDAADE